jgi:transposase InsO family protein
LAPLRTLVDERPTYGYRRITALLNRERLKNSLPRLNHKRIYRLMSQNGMLLQRYTGKPPLTRASLSRSDPTCDGRPMVWKSLAGTVRW